MPKPGPARHEPGLTRSEPKQPKSFLIQILVTVNANGSFKTTVRSYFEGTVVEGPLLVNIGDHVGWLVQVTGARLPIPYNLGFSSASFFGVSSLEVPTGGASRFLTVLALKDTISYTLHVTGVGCVFDPVIQSGSDNMKYPHASLTASVFAVTCNTATRTITYRKDSVARPFPMVVADRDKVRFTATAATGPVTGFTVTFAENTHGWATPFDPTNRSLFADPATPTNIGPVGVADPVDPGADFPFTVSVMVGGVPVDFLTAPSMKMAP